MRIRFTYEDQAHLLNCGENFAMLLMELDLIFCWKLPEDRALICNDLYENSFLIADQKDFDAYKKDLQAGFAVTATLNIAPPMGQCRYKDREQYYISAQFDNVNRKSKDLSDDEDNDAELFQKALLEAALAKEDDKTKVDQYSDTPSVTHYFTRCNGCQVSPIVGVRYKCTVCPNFNYCEGCYQMFEHSHNFAKMKEADDFAAFKCELKQKKLSVKAAEWMKFDPNADSLIQELFNVRKNAPEKNDQDEGPKKKFVAKDSDLLEKNEEKKQASSMETDEKIVRLLEYFPDENVKNLHSFVLQAPSDMSFKELKESYRHKIVLRFLGVSGNDPKK